MNELANKKVLVFDWGLCPELAVKLGEKFGEVLYFVPWGDAFPKSEKALIGDGLQEYNVRRVQTFWDYIDHVDMICFFDTYTYDLAEYLRDKGYRVFGAGFGEMLETDRWYGREVQRKAGLPVQPTRKIIGLDNLKAHLTNEKDKFIKINGFRGDIETFQFYDMDSSEMKLDYLANIMGAKKNDIEFVVEDGIQGIEPGYDGIVVDGQYPDKGLFAYELKGRGYIAKMVDYKNMPEPIKLINDKLAPFFKEYQTRSLFSTEAIVTPEGKGYLIDPTVRAGMPCPTAVEMEMITNLPEIIWNAADGLLIPVQDAGYKYGVGVALDSEWANKNWLEIKLDESVRKFIKFRRFIKKDGKYFAVPGFQSVCSVVGLGNTPDEAFNHAKENVKGVKGFELDNDAGGIQKAIDEAKQGTEKYHLEF